MIFAKIVFPNFEFDHHFTLIIIECCWPQCANYIGRDAFFNTNRGKPKHVFTSLMDQTGNLTLLAATFINICRFFTTRDDAKETQQSVFVRLISCRRVIKMARLWPTKIQMRWVIILMGCFWKFPSRSQPFTDWFSKLDFWRNLTWTSRIPLCAIMYLSSSESVNYYNKSFKMLLEDTFVYLQLYHRIFIKMNCSHGQSMN